MIKCKTMVIHTFVIISISLSFIYNSLSSEAAFFIAHDSEPVDIILLMVVVSIGVPLLLTAAISLISLPFSRLTTLQVVGSNISSAGSPDYTRLSPRLDPLQGQLLTGDLQPGAGVALTEIQRNIDEALEGRVRLAIGSEASALALQQTLAQVEALFDDLSGAGISTRLSEFYTSFDEVQNTPEEMAVRDFAVMSAVRLAESIRALRGQLTMLSDSIDGQIGAIVDRADEIAQEIARLNEEITTAEAGRSAEPSTCSISSFLMGSST